MGQNWHLDENDNVILDETGDTVPGNFMTLADGQTHLVRYEATLCGKALKEADFPDPATAVDPAAPFCNGCFEMAKELAGR